MQTLLLKNHFGDLEFDNNSIDLETIRQVQNVYSRIFLKTKETFFKEFQMQVLRNNLKGVPDEVLTDYCLYHSLIGEEPYMDSETIEDLLESEIPIYYFEEQKNEINKEIKNENTAVDNYQGTWEQKSAIQREEMIGSKYAVYSRAYRTVLNMLDIKKRREKE